MYVSTTTNGPRLTGATTLASTAASRVSLDRVVVPVHLVLVVLIYRVGQRISPNGVEAFCLYTCYFYRPCIAGKVALAYPFLRPRDQDDILHAVDSRHSSNPWDGFASCSEVPHSIWARRLSRTHPTLTCSPSENPLAGASSQACCYRAGRPSYLFSNPQSSEECFLSECQVNSRQ